MGIPYAATEIIEVLRGGNSDEKRDSQEEVSEDGQAENQDTCYLSAESE